MKKLKKLTAIFLSYIMAVGILAAAVPTAGAVEDTSVQDVISELIAEGKIDASLSEAYNVCDYGADSTGTEDSTDAFEACVKAANGNPIIVPDGTYIVNHCVPMADDGSDYYVTPIVMVGIGNPIIKRTVMTDTTQSMSSDRSMFLFYGVTSAYINNITFDSQRDSFIEASSGKWLGTALVYFYGGGSNVVIEGCTFTNCSREAVYCKGTFDNVQIRNCNFVNVSANVWSTDGGLSNFTFENNYSKNCRTTALELNTANQYESSNFYIANNQFEDIQQAAVSIRNVRNVLVENNSYDYLSADEIDEETETKMGGGASSLTCLVYINTDKKSETVVGTNGSSDITVRNNSGAAVYAVYAALANGTTGVSDTDTVFDNILVENNTFNCSGALCRITYATNAVVRGNTAGGDLSKGAYSLTKVSDFTAYGNTIDAGEEKLPKATVSDGTLSVSGYEYTDLCRLSLSKDTTVTDVNMIAEAGQKLTICVSGASLEIGGITAELGGTATLFYNGTSWVSTFFGDVDNNGVINIADATEVQKAVARLTELDSVRAVAADVNGDGNVDVTDATTIQKYIARLIDKFPAEQ